MIIAKKETRGQNNEIISEHSPWQRPDKTVFKAITTTLNNINKMGTDNEGREFVLKAHSLPCSCRYDICKRESPEKGGFKGKMLNAVKICLLCCSGNYGNYKMSVMLRNNKMHSSRRMMRELRPEWPLSQNAGEFTILIGQYLNTWEECWTLIGSHLHHTCSTANISF